MNCIKVCMRDMDMRKKRKNVWKILVSEKNLSLVLICVSVCAVRMRVMPMVSLSLSPLHPRLLFSLPSWQHSSPSPMMTRRTPGVATSTRCYPIRTDPVPSTLFMYSLVFSRCVCVFVFYSQHLACTDFDTRVNIYIHTILFSPPCFL